MSISYEQVMDDILYLFTQLSDDWEYSGTFTPETGLMSDLGFESLELVILGVYIQEHYKQTIPFPEFLADLGEREVPDIFLGDLVGFIHRHLDKAAVGGA